MAKKTKDQTIAELTARLAKALKANEELRAAVACDCEPDPAADDLANMLDDIREREASVEWHAYWRERDRAAGMAIPAGREGQP